MIKFKTSILSLCLGLGLSGALIETAIAFPTHPGYACGQESKCYKLDNVYEFESCIDNTRRNCRG